MVLGAILSLMSLCFIISEYNMLGNGQSCTEKSKFEIFE